MITAGLVLAPWGVLPWAIVPPRRDRLDHRRPARSLGAPQLAASKYASTDARRSATDVLALRLASSFARKTSSSACLPTLKQAPRRRGRAARSASLNDVAVAILASRFGVPFAPSGRRRRAAARPSGVVLLRMPRELKDALAAEARASAGRNTHDLIVETLSRAARSRRSNRERTVHSGRPQNGINGSTNGTGPARRTRSASRSSASATAPTRCSRASSTTRTPPTTSSSPA